MLKKTLVAILLLAILAGGWYLLSDKTSERTALPAPTAAGIETPKQQQSLINDTAQATAESLPSITDKSTTIASTNLAEQIDSNNFEDDTTTAKTEVDVSSIAVEPLSDSEFISLERQMRTNKELRLRILDEFRYNTDPTRAKQLAALLGPYNDPEIVQIASELAYSGNPQSQRAGLDLLSRIQPHNNNARDVAIGLLNSENNPEMLVATMNALATPTQTATNEQRQLLTDNLNNLALHQDSRVRAQSLSLLGRWNQNSPSTIESLTRGLSDSEPEVRSSAAFALNNVSNPNQEMIDGLLAIAENTSEKKSSRFAALDALGKMSLTGISLRRYSAAKINVNRRNG